VRRGVPKELKSKSKPIENTSSFSLFFIKIGPSLADFELSAEEMNGLEAY